ncbi:MAG: UDP-N-acetylmuramoyl-L-alanyl-D-glutamate--2,6-diaminopimelate ligase [Saprospiraceae bacterium]|nr:MAG: UDP-N-acetylmuramoyl-L-alanyl-D-glutamate--2,6-diaminopimelate ligase [Saprospiraceae bacterium]
MKHPLSAILKNVPLLEIVGTVDRKISQLDFDSRSVKKESLFAALRGTQVDGHQYIEKAIASGATVIVAETLPDHPDDRVTWIKVKDSAQSLGMMASNFYGRPTEHLKLVGVTGTNGKTTTATLLHQLFQNLGYKVGLISTIENKIGHKVLPATHTTPDAVAINALLADMVEAGCDYVFMEVSSHAVDQRRIAGLHFTGGIFTNITHDHLDYHKTFRAYIEAKKRFFDELPSTAFALVNIDDRRGEVMVQNTAARVYKYSLRQLADYKARIVESNLTGLLLEFDNKEFFSRLIGKFNVYNLLSVYATAILLDQEQMEVLQVLSTLHSAEGRFDYVQDPYREITAIVDYAHTPDALEKVLDTIVSLREASNRVITVVGCGGDRDKSKRPLMAKVACDYSDQVILTSDNPRTEVPATILADMETGIPAYAKQKVLVIEDRKSAILAASRMAQKTDIILVAGKGHEKYQEIKGVKYPFDDKQILKEEFAVNG